MNFKIKLIVDSASSGRLPEKGTYDAGAYDVYAREIIETDKYVKVKLGFKTEIPKGFKALLIPRSSISDTGWILANSIGLIDSDFRGEWQMRFVKNHKETPVGLGIISDGNGGYVETPEQNPFPYSVGDRCGQFFLQKVEELDFKVIYDNLETTNRGEGGFGSTGKN